MRVVALGRTRMLLNTMTQLKELGHELPLVATCRAAPEYDIREADFAAAARDMGARFLNTADLNTADAIAHLRAVHADVAVSVNWIHRLGAEACASFPHGILNAHAGDLPRYRGNAPVAWAILNGEPYVGVCIHRMEPDVIDAGPVLRRERIPLTEQSYIGDVFAALENVVPHLFLEAVESIRTATVREERQDHGQSLRGYARRTEDGAISWSSSAVDIGRLVRASAEPFAGAYARHGDGRLIVWRARPIEWTERYRAVPGHVLQIDRSSGNVAVATGDGVLALELVQPQDATERCAPATIMRSTRERVWNG